jgi:hypothetical protein
VGSRLPTEPNAARDTTSVGALARFPARLMNPTSRNDSTVPTIITMIAWARLSP